MELTVAHAEARVKVRTPDGRIGTLVYVAYRGVNATVVIVGRHYRYRAAELELVEPWDDFFGTLDGRHSPTRDFAGPPR